MDTKTYSNRSNCIRAARVALGADAKPDVDFYLLGGNTAWQWQERDPEPAVHIADLHKSDDPVAKANATSWDAVLPKKRKAAPAVIQTREGLKVEPTEEAAEPLPASVSKPKAGRNHKAVAASAEKRGALASSLIITLVNLLKRPEGVTLAQAQAATKWQPHTIRARISVDVAKKMGLPVQRTRGEDGASIYRVAA